MSIPPATPPSRRSFLKGGTALLGSLALGSVVRDARAADGAPTDPAPGVPTKRPNLVFFLGEGVRWDEFSCTGNPIIQTPHQDRIAREGMRFSNAFVTHAVCAPSRASIYTGLHSHGTSVVDNRMRQAIPRDIPLVSDLLRNAGYEVAFLGKAHVKDGWRDREWDYYLGFNGAGTNYYNPVLWEGIHGTWTGPTTYEGYVDDLITDRALQWLDQPRDKPFCLFINFCAPHAPFYRPRRLLDLYNGVPIPKPATFDDDLKHPPYPGKPSAFVDARNKIGTTILSNDDPRSLEELVKDHYAGVVDNDDNVGRVVQWLERSGQSDDTAIMLSSDHGFFLGEWRMFDKRFMHEPSIRVPLMIRYPRMIKPGTVCERMALNIDLAPTLLELAGLPVPSNMHGRSLVPLLQGRAVADWRTDWLYEYFEYPDWEQVRPHRGVRTERYKLIHYHKLPAFPHLPEEFELYDLQQDPGEIHNLHGTPGYDSLANRLLDRLAELRRETGDQTTDATM